MSSDEDVKISVTTETEQATEDLKQVDEAAAGIGVSGEAGAAGLESMASKGDVLAGALEGINDEARDALKELEKMGRGGSDEAAKLKTSIANVDKAVEALGSEARKSLNPMTQGFDLAQKAADRLDKEISEGSPRSAAALNRLVLTMSALRSAIDAARSSGAQLSAEQETQYAQLGTRLDAAKEKLRGMNDELRNNKSELAQGGAEWRGLSGSIEQAAGSYGSVVAKAGLVTAAFREGWQIGQKLNAFFGVEMGGWESTVKNFGLRVGEIVKALSTGIVAQVNLVMAAARLDWKETKRLLSEVPQVVEEIRNKIKFAVTSTTAEFDLYKGAAERAMGASHAAAEAAKKLAAEKEELAKKTDAVTKSILDETTALELSKIAGQDATRSLADRSSQLRYYDTSLQSANSALTAQKQKVAELTAQYGATDPMTKQARESQDQLALAVDSAKKRFDETKQEVARYEAQQKSAKDAAERHAEAIEKQNLKLAELRPAVASVNVEQERGITIAGEGTKADENTIVIRGKVFKVTSDLAKEAGAAATATEKLATAATTAETPLTKLATAAEAVVKPIATGFGEATTQAAALNTQLLVLVGTFQKLKTAAEEAGGAIEKASNAGLDEESAEEGFGTGGAF